jgi:hypothetical protein
MNIHSKICLAAAIALASSAVSTGCRNGNSSRSHGTAKAERGAFVFKVTEDAEIKPAETFDVMVPNQLNGPRESFILDDLPPDGEPVRAGDVIFQFNTKEILQRVKDSGVRVEQAKERFEDSRKKAEVSKPNLKVDLERAKSAVKVAELDLVRLQEPLEEDKQIALKELEKAKEDQKAAEEDYRAAEALALHGAVPPSEVETKLTAKELARLRTEIQALNKKKAEEGDDPLAIPNAKRAVERAKLNVELARINMEAQTRVLDRDVERRQADLKREQDVLKDFEKQIELRTGKAKLAGILVYASDWKNEKVQKGNQIWRGMTIVRIANGERFLVRTQIPERYIRYVSDSGHPRGVEGLRIDVRPEGLDDRKDKYKARITWIDRWAHDRNEKMTPQDRKAHGPAGVKVFWLEAEIANPRADGEKASVLRFGMRAMVDFYVTVPDAVTVPREAIIPSGGRTFVMVRSVGIDRMTPVSLGPENETHVQVIHGLDGGEEVVIGGG